MPGCNSDKRGPRERSGWLVNTPFHPQWLIPRRNVAAEVRAARGIVLDIGAADGWVARWLSPAATYVRLDYPATALGLYGIKPDIFADATQLPFSDGSIEAATCYEVLEHVRDPDAVLSEVSRVLAPDGVVEFTMPFLYPVHDAPYDYQRWTRHGWERSLAAHGLKLVHLHEGNVSLHAGAVVAALCVAAPLQGLRGLALAWRLPIAAVLVFWINSIAKILGWVWPTWGAATTSHRVLARKPRGEA